MRSFLCLWLLGVILVLAGGCADQPQVLRLRDPLNRTPVRHALLMMELDAVYDLASYNPMPGVRRRDRYAKWMKKAIKYGYDYTPDNRPFVPGFYYNPAAFEDYPFVQTPGPDQIRLQYISDGWNIFYSEDSLDENQPSYRVAVYFIFKPGFIPARLTPKELAILENKQRQAVVALRPIQPGTMASDREVLYAAEDVLGALPNAETIIGQQFRRQLLERLATSLRQIVKLPTGGGAYPEFPGAQALARKHLERIHQLDPSLPRAK